MLHLLGHLIDDLVAVEFSNTFAVVLIVIFGVVIRKSFFWRVFPHLLFINSDPFALFRMGFLAVPGHQHGVI